jgi:Domain of unknown function (DUF1905)/Bacteriocin-protection, YdeI or OmpD-Associated
VTNLHFTSTINIREGNPYILVSGQQAEKLKAGWKKPMPVVIQINGKPDIPWKINMMPIGDGGFYLYLHGDVRRASRTKVGDTVIVDVRFDSEYKNGPQHEIPKWFSEALAKNAVAYQNWGKLIPSRKKEILRYFSWLKSDEAIARNIKKAIDVLSGKTGRFMARAWEDGK